MPRPLLATRLPAASLAVSVAVAVPQSGTFAGAIARVDCDRLTGPGVTVRGGTVRPVQYPGGEGVAADVDDNGHDAEAVVISSPQGAVIVELVTPSGTATCSEKTPMIIALHESFGFNRFAFAFAVSGSLHEAGLHVLHVSCNTGARLGQYLKVDIRPSAKEPTA